MLPSSTALNVSLSLRLNIALVTLCVLSLAISLAIPASYSNWPLWGVLAVASGPMLWNIGKELLKGDLGADLLAALALISSIWLTEYMAAVLIVIMLAGGQTLEVYAMRKASSVLQALAARMPSIAHRKHGPQLEDIGVTDIAIGDEIVVFPHEVAPVDGIVLDGNGTMDESYLTGEPFHISKAPGSQVLSGAINGDAVLIIQAQKIAHDSRYAQIMSVMQEAEQKRPKLRRIADQIGAFFAPFALLVALLAWYISGDAIRFLAVLVVATPCPLLIAIPITLISAISIAAKHSIIIKDPTVLERLPTCRTAIFDKTGTLTYGKPQLTDIFISPFSAFTKEEILRLVASLERYSKHPLANAILNSAMKSGLAIREAGNVSEKPGQGLSGMICGYEVRVTHRKKLLQEQPDIASQLPAATTGLECVIVINNTYAATFHFRDSPRTEGKPFISHLAPAHQFNKIMLVSGDRESEVNYLADLLNINESLASQSPEQKLAVVRAETAKAPTLFMGDGINDAPALASATVGIAFGQHSAITAEAAGAVIMENSLAKVDTLIHIADAMRNIVLQSALGGMLLSIIAIGFAAAGYISPVIGALLQEVIDILAIANALRLNWHSIQTDISDN